MQLYLAGYDYLGIAPIVMQRFVVAFEILFLSFAFVSLTRAIRPDADYGLLLVVVALVIASSVREMNLARFGTGTFIGQYYVAADGFRILAVAQVLRRKYVQAGLLLLASLITHFTMGLFALVFVAAMVLVAPRPLKEIKTWIGAAIVLAGGALWILLTVKASEIAGGQIPLNLWVSLSKMMCYHWYPVSLGVFGLRHYAIFLPFLGFCLLLVYFVWRQGPLSEDRRRLMAGCAAMAVLVGLGVLFSVYPFSSSLIKLSLSRANDMILNVGLVIVAAGLYDEIKSAGLWRKIIAMAVLLSPFFGVYGHPGFPTIWCLLVTLPCWLALARVDAKRRFNIVMVVLGASIVGLLILYWAMGMARPLMNPAYVGSPAFLWTVAGMGAVFAATGFLARRNDEWRGRILTYIAVGACFVVAFLWLSNQNMRPEVQERYHAFGQAQLWAKNHTAPDSLFMVDPSLGGGWRALSQRASWGGAREWLYSAWIYASNYPLLKEGLHRLGYFGLDLDKYLKYRRSIVGWNKLRKDLRESFYSKDDQWRRDLAKQYGIDYFVLQNKYFTGKSNLDEVYKNKYFVILAADARHHGGGRHK